MASMASRPVTRLLAAGRMAPQADEPAGYWLSTLAEDTPMEELARLAKIRWRGRARLPRAENRPRPGPLRGPLLPRLAPPCHPRRPGPGLLHPAPDRPKSACAGMALYQVLHELQIVLALILGACPLCRQPVTPERLTTALTST